jgi:histidine triad (HIT) family protein
MSDCPFCAIAAGERSAHVLFEDDRTFAFLDENPAVDGHTLVAPKAHRTELLASESPASAAVLETVADVAEGLGETLHPDGFSVFYTSGELTGNVTHAHVHVLPRRADDDVSLSLVRREYDPGRAEDIAAAVRGHRTE